MTESMKFGPQWLLRLSQDNSSTQPSVSTVPRYQLADYRYGREELLALSSNVGPAPETVVNMPTLYVEKTLPPLALIHMTEEETRMWNRGINSDAVLRHSSKTQANVGNSTRGGRGGSVDRGRGRGRGGGSGSFYSRGLSYEDPGDGTSSRLERGEGGITSGSGLARNVRPFDRSQSERNWGERNGADPPDWNSGTSPRKEFGTGRNFMGDNWRRHRPASEEDDGWRTTPNNRTTDKWNRGGSNSSWREGEKESTGDPDRSSRTWDRSRGWDDSHNPSRRNFNEDHLPEWAVENPSETGGTFDSTGAFHGNSDDEEVSRLNSGETRTNNHQNRKTSSEHGNNNKQKKPGPQKSSSREVNLNVQNSIQREDSEPKSEEVTNSVSNEPVEKNIPKVPKSENKSKPSVCANVPTSPPPAKVSETRDNSETVPLNISKSKPVTSQVSNRDSDVSESTANCTVTQKLLPTSSVSNVINHVSQNAPSHDSHMNHHKSDDDLQRMRQVAEEVVKLVDDEEHKVKPPSLHHQTPHQTTVPTASSDKWYYRDPQGNEQGPFSSREMADWFRTGYFSETLLVRRSCEDRYSQLGDLVRTFGRIPFLTGPHDLSEIAPPTTKTANIPAPIDSEAMIMEQYRVQMLKKQIMWRQQQAIDAAIAKLAKTDNWKTLSPLEQQQCISHIIAQHKSSDSFIHNVAPASPLTDSVLQLFTQLQQSKLPPTSLLDKLPSVPPPIPTSVPTPPLDPLQQLIQQMGGLQHQTANPLLPHQSMPPVSHPNIPIKHTNVIHSSVPDDSDPNDLAVDHMQMLLRQLNASKPQSESIWNSGNMNMPFSNSNQRWFSQVGPPPGQLPMSLWDLHGKEMKTEQEILEEQRRAAEEGRREELRKQEEERKRKEKEELARIDGERKEADRRLIEEQLKRIEELKRKDEERKMMEEERRRREEEQEAKKIEAESRKLKEEAARRKEEDKKRREEEKERKRKLEEERRRHEELRQQEEEERRRQEEELVRKRAEEESRLEQQRRQAEALRRLQEQQMRAKTTPWNQQTAPAPSLAEVQRQERERKEREIREFQQQMAILQLTSNQQQQQQHSPPENKNSLQLNWANMKPAVSKVKSLAEIQAEEHEQMLKQQERERAERVQQQKDTVLPPMSSIWGSAAQNLSWAQTTSAWNSGANGNTGVGFWEDVITPISKSNMPSNKANPMKAAKPVSNNMNAALKNVSASKARSKKEEAVVMKLFENNVQRTDEFTEWCSKALTALQASVDIPTFVGFLRDIESPFEVKDYVRMYLGDGKDTQDFARQFLERRSKWRNMQRTTQAEDDMCVPAAAINPLNSDFTEVKGKGKKPKKNKMLPVDHRILGFNVTASEDRINVGDRDYGEGL